mmetsp:Transcript_24391/g.75199  ORF Transcript_24391/g.75199 Transcript_24391/m.75199 type:complete len:213 (+) Transcript_24391:962-1600(+)
MRDVRPPRVRGVLELGLQDERLPEVALLAQHRQVHVQHRHRQEDCHLRLRVQEGHRRHARDGRRVHRARPDRGAGARARLRPPGLARDDDDGVQVHVELVRGDEAGAERPRHHVARPVLGGGGIARHRHRDGVGRVQDAGLQEDLRLHGQTGLRLRRPEHRRRGRAAQNRLHRLLHRQARRHELELFAEMRVVSSSPKHNQAYFHSRAGGFF